MPDVKIAPAIIYVGQNSAPHKLVPQNADFIALHYDNWDDFSRKTRFPTSCRISGRDVELGAIKILFKGHKTSWLYMDELAKSGWNRTIPFTIVPTEVAEFVSVPEELDFYRLLIAECGVDAALDVASALRDASVMNIWLRDSRAAELCSTTDFSASLLRNINSQRTYANSWKLFTSEKFSISDFSTTTKLDGTNEFTVNFSFKHPILPSNLNILIGPNGCGKTQTLVQMVRRLISPDKKDAEALAKSGMVDFGKIIVLSYSPFDNFPIDVESLGVKGTSKTYSYFGFRERIAGSKEYKEEFSLTKPQRDSVLAIKRMVEDDIRFTNLREWPSKIDAARRLLTRAIPRIAKIVLHIPKKKIAESVFLEAFEQSHGDSENMQVDVTRDNAHKISTIPDEIISECRIRLIDSSGSAIQLSSGQRLFLYVVSSLLGGIEINSLILLDEPELFLHPTLEVELIGLINEILSIYDSKAIISTHSLVAVRETPSRSVNVLRRIESSGNIECSKPPFETLGGDLQRISSYAFGDKSINKPFERWISSALKEAGSADKLIEKLSENINEELIIRIRSTRVEAE